MRLQRVWPPLSSLTVSPPTWPLFAPPLPPLCSSNPPGMFLPQGLCTGCFHSRCLLLSFPEVHGAPSIPSFSFLLNDPLQWRLHWPPPKMSTSTIIPIPLPRSVFFPQHSPLTQRIFYLLVRWLSPTGMSAPWEHRHLCLFFFNCHTPSLWHTVFNKYLFNEWANESPLLSSMNGPNYPQRPRHPGVDGVGHLKRIPSQQMGSEYKQIFRALNENIKIVCWANLNLYFHMPLEKVVKYLLIIFNLLV